VYVALKGAQMIEKRRSCSFNNVYIFLKMQQTSHCYSSNLVFVFYASYEMRPGSPKMNVFSLQMFSCLFMCTNVLSHCHLFDECLKTQTTMGRGRCVFVSLLNQ